ncbi:hypothetical protein [uncultured Mediterranean phage uvMED]|nr:hypothetical protein [uncultured Mediterranean phage uvMED]
METAKELELELALIKELAEEIRGILDEAREFGIQQEVLRLMKGCLVSKNKSRETLVISKKH